MSEFANVFDLDERIAHVRATKPMTPYRRGILAGLTKEAERAPYLRAYTAKQWEAGYRQGRTERLTAERSHPDGC